MEKLLREEMEAKERKRRAWRQKRVNFVLRRGLLSSGGILVDRGNHKTINATIDFDSYLGFNRYADKKDYLSMEEQVWKAAMEYCKAKDVFSDYDLVPDYMTMYPVIFESQTWYHCNLLGQKRDPIHPSRTLFFVEVKCKAECMKATNYHVTACIALDENNCNTCRICPASRDILHPLRGGFICGSEDGQKVFHYTIPVKIPSSDTCNEKTPIAIMNKSTCSDYCTGPTVKGEQDVAKIALKPSNLNVADQLINSTSGLRGQQALVQMSCLADLS